MAISTSSIVRSLTLGALILTFTGRADFSFAEKARNQRTNSDVKKEEPQRFSLNPAIFPSGRWSLEITSNKNLAVTRSIMGSVVFTAGKPAEKVQNSTSSQALIPKMPIVYCEFGSHNPLSLQNPKGKYEVVQIQDGKEENLNLVELGLLRDSDQMFLTLSCAKSSGGFFYIDEVASTLGAYAHFTEKKEELKFTEDSIQGLPRIPTEILQLIHTAESNNTLFASTSYRFGISLESATLTDVNPINDYSFPGLFYPDLFGGRFLQSGRPKTFSELEKHKAFCVSFAKAKILALDTSLNYRIRIIESRSTKSESLWVTTSYWYPLIPQPAQASSDSMDMSGMISDGTLHIACVSPKPLLWKEMKEISGLPLEFKVGSYKDFLEENPELKSQPSMEVPEGFFNRDP